MNTISATRLFALLPLTILFAFLCSDASGQTGRIDFSGKNTDIHMKLSQLADSVAYIPLKLPDSVMVSVDMDICLSDHYILVKDRSMKQVLLLSPDGRFIRRISGNGNGQGEFASLQDATIDESADRIFILDVVNHVILAFSLQNAFMGTIKVENWPRHLAIMGHEKLLVLTPYVGKDQAQSPHLYQIGYNGQVLHKTYLQEGADHQDFISFAQLYHYKDTLCLYQKEADTIFCIGDDGVLTPRYTLTDKEMIPTGYRHSVELLRQYAPSYFRLHAVFETSRYLFINGAYKAFRRTMVYDKVTGQLNNAIYKLDILDYGLENDIDGGMPFWPTGQADEKYLYSILDPGKFRKIVLNDYNKSLPFKDSLQHAKMLDLLNHTTGYGNPIIELVRVK